MKWNSNVQELGLFSIPFIAHFEITHTMTSVRSELMHGPQEFFLYFSFQISVGYAFATTTSCLFWPN